jgi:hypothetical protein
MKNYLREMMAADNFPNLSACSFCDTIFIFNLYICINSATLAIQEYTTYSSMYHS